jgi:hypothetical protein
MNTHFNNLPTTINGDKVIKFTSSKFVKDNGLMDRPSMSSWYEQDPEKNFLGVVDLFTNFSQVRIPMMKGLLDKKAILNVNGMDGTFTYELPVYKSTCAVTMKDTSEEYEQPGIDESYFQIALSKAYKPGEKLTYSLQYGEQVIVSEDYQVVQEGDYYIHTVMLIGNDPEKWFPKDKLKKGVEYVKIGQSLGENSVQFGGVDFEETGSTIKCEFTLGNHRGFETSISMYADKKSFSGANTKTKDMWNTLMNKAEMQVDEAGNKADMFMVANIDKATGKAKRSTTTFGSVLEYFTILENIKAEATELLFQKGGIVKESNGFKRLNEGAWLQYRRGRRYEYTRPGGINREILRQVSAYIFQGRTDLLPHKRKIHFRAGTGAYQNMLTLFRTEFGLQNSELAPLMGTDRVIPNPVTGGLDGLKMQAVIIDGVFIPEIGMVTVEHDPSLDYEVGSDRATKGFTGQGYSYGSYSMVIYDAASEQYSNARQNLPQGTTLISGGNKNSNMYYVKPEGEAMYWGYENGRYASTAGQIQSSNPHMSKTFWVHSASACWIKDVSRYIVVELKR